MSFDAHEFAAGELTEYESKIAYDVTKTGNPKLPGIAEARLRDLMSQDPPSCWSALKATSADQGALRLAQMQCSADFVLETWKRDYAQLSRRQAPAGLDTLTGPARAAVSVLADLPPAAWSLACQLQLATDFFSKDECTFGMTENPIRRDRALGDFVIAASGWKGALRGAFRALHGDGTAPETRLFGPAKRDAGDDDQDGLARGRLIIHPTIIPYSAERTRLRIINPHSRKTKTGKNPIIYEVISRDTQCGLEMLYLPWAWTELEPETHLRQVAEDVQALAPALKAMCECLGVGGKTSSGFGGFRLLKGQVATERAARDFKTWDNLPGAYLAALAVPAGGANSDGH